MFGEIEGEVQSENDKVLDEIINSSVLDKMIDMHVPEMSGELLDALEELRQEFLEKERK